MNAADGISFESRRLRFRHAAEQDRPALEHLLQDADVMRHYPEFARPGAGARWLDSVNRLYTDPGFGPLTVELHDGTFVGQCGPLPHEIDGRPEIEIICFFERAFWCHGLAEEAARACMHMIFTQLRAPRIVALIHPKNRPSARLALRCGLRYERDVEKDGAIMALYAIAPS